MFSLNIQSRAVYFRDIKLEQLPQLLKWYNQIDDFKYATGIDQPLSHALLVQKYAEVAICSNEFFVGIYTSEEKKMIGILKGRVGHKNQNVVWISSIVIDCDFQRKGYGSSSIKLMLEHLVRHNGIKGALLAVIEDNEQGLSFWNKHDFHELRRIENHILLQEKQQNVIIMQKIL